MAKLIQIAVDSEGFLWALDDEGNVWFHEDSEWKLCNPPNPWITTGGEEIER